MTTINSALKEICCLLKARPWELGIFSSSKGLIAGKLIITFSDGSRFDCGQFLGGEFLYDLLNLQNIGFIISGTILPHITSDIVNIETTVAFVLVVEKHTVFEKLLQENVLTRLGQECILLTVSKQYFV